MFGKKMLVALLIGFSSAVFADTVALSPDHPDRYVVVKGDTLWDISARFLRDPWRWPDVWGINPEIKNPHLIYPGDVIRLTYKEDGTPVLTVEKRAEAGAAPERIEPPRTGTRLSPQIHTSPLTEAPIPTIPYDSISHFLSRTRVLSERDIDGSAYIVATQEDRLIAGEGNKIYVRGIAPGAGERFNIVHVGDPYRNPGAEKEDILGYEGIYLGEARLEKRADPSTLIIVSSKREALIGDRLLPVDVESFNPYFTPHAPSASVEGQIIGVLDGVSRIGQFQIVVINKGESDGLETGHVLAVFRKGEAQRDPVRTDLKEPVQLPDERAGVAMVFRTSERVSYAIVMSAYREMRVFDAVRNP